MLAKQFTDRHIVDRDQVRHRLERAVDTPSISPTSWSTLARALELGDPCCLSPNGRILTLTSIRTLAPERDGDNELLECLDVVISERFPVHPFERGLNAANFAAVMNEFVAMSTAFPYIQAGAVYESYRRSMAAHGIPNANTKITAAVSAFLIWDEFGGNHLGVKSSANGVSRMIEVDSYFHSALLIRDVETLLGAPLPAAVPGPSTQAYLERLLENLAGPSGNRNVAHMVAFERHAMAMINALRAGMTGVFGANAMEGLAYFDAHIGSSCVGEAIHVGLTESMISRLVTKDETARFLDTCVDAYAFNVRWCQDVVAQANEARREAVIG